MSLGSFFFYLGADFLNKSCKANLATSATFLSAIS